jgi:hypothetical protein
LCIAYLMMLSFVMLICGISDSELEKVWMEVEMTYVKVLS